MDVKAHPWCAVLKLAKICPTGIDMMASQFDLNVVVRQDARPEAQTGVLRISCNFTYKILSSEMQERGGPGLRVRRFRMRSRPPKLPATHYFLW